MQRDTLRFFSGRRWISRAAQNKKEPGSRLPAAASCLGRHAHPAGRSPNSSSLFLPLAAVVAVAVRIHPCVPFVRQIKQKLQYPVRILEFLVGAGGFEPPKLKSSRFTVCPHWPLGNTPIFIFVRPFAGRLAYFSMGNGFCQLFFTFFFKAFLHPSKAGCGNAAGFVRKRRTSVFFAAKIFIG